MSNYAPVRLCTIPSPNVLPLSLDCTQVMAQAGVASRRACETLIASSVVKVNGKVVTEQGLMVDLSKVSFYEHFLFDVTSKIPLCPRFGLESRCLAIVFRSPEWFPRLLTLPCWCEF